MKTASVHPGETLTEAIEARGITRYVVAKRTGMTPSAVGDIVDGKRSITAANALLLGRLFGTSPEFWMNLQVAHDLDKARAELGDRLAKVTPLS